MKESRDKEGETYHDGDGVVVPMDKETEQGWVEIEETNTHLSHQWWEHTLANP